MTRLRVPLIAAVSALLLSGCEVVDAFFGECSSVSSTGVFEDLESSGCSGNFSNWSGGWSMDLHPYAESHPLFDHLTLFFAGPMKTGAYGSGSVYLMDPLSPIEGMAVGYFDYEVLEFNATSSERLDEGTVKLRIEHLEADFGVYGKGTFQANIKTMVIGL